MDIQHELQKMKKPHLDNKSFSDKINHLEKLGFVNCKGPQVAIMPTNKNAEPRMIQSEPLPAFFNPMICNALSK